MFGLSPAHLFLILIVVVLIFGTSKLKNMGKDLGGAVKGFKEAMKDPTEHAQLDKDQTIEGVKQRQNEQNLV
jgi:sec-independent protein translocase protein TatA